MRVALVNNFHPFTGIGKYAFNLHARLRAMGYPVEMLYLESRDNKLAEMEGVRKLVQGLHLPLFNKTFSWYSYFPPRIPEGYDLYHASSHYLLRVARYRKPTVITHMDLAPLLYPQDYPYLLRKALERSLRDYGEAERIIAISQGSKEELVASGHADEGKVTVIHPGYDETLYRPIPREEARAAMGLDQGETIILHVGSEERRKNVPTLLKAMRLLKGDPLLVRVGSRSPECALLEKGLKVLHFSGVEERQMPFFYSAADLFAFPSTYEGNFAYPPLEAMACGVPTIVTEGVRLFSRGCCIYTPPESPEALAAGMEEVLRERERYSAMAREEAKGYTLGEEAEKTMTLYREVLG